MSRGDFRNDDDRATTSHSARQVSNRASMASDSSSENQEATFWQEEQHPIDFDLNHRPDVVFVPGKKSVLDLYVGR